MAYNVDLSEAETRLEELVDRAAAGEEIIITRAGQPVARIVAIGASRPRRVPGAWRGRVSIAPDFDQ